MRGTSLQRKRLKKFKKRGINTDLATNFCHWSCQFVQIDQNCRVVNDEFVASMNVETVISQTGTVGECFSRRAEKEISG